MSIEKMQLVNIAGKLKNLDAVIEKCIANYEKKYGDDNMTEEFLSLVVWVDKLTGFEHLYDIASFGTYDECKEDDKVNRTLFNGRCNCYILFITGKRLVFLKDKPLYVVIEAEAIER